MNYRNATATDYRTFVSAYGTSFNYDDNLNRTAADFGNPFGDGGNTSDEYAINAANEYTQIERNLGNTNPAHDAAGNWTTLPVRPASGASAGVNVNATGPYTALNMLFSITAGSNAEQHYRYDALHRRIAVMELDGPADTATAPITGRRFIWDGWSVIEERVFESGATLGDPAERLERIYIEGPQIDEHLLAAIDGDGDGALTTNINQPSEPNTPNSNDYEYYYLHNRLGNVMGINNAADSRKMLEYYRYSVYGEATVLPVVDENEDGIEDTPLDLSDNFEQMAETREASGDQAHGRVSRFNNQYTFTGRYNDEATGQLYYRMRQYEPVSGRFTARDDAEEMPEALYHYGRNVSTVYVDPTGLATYRLEWFTHRGPDYYGTGGSFRWTIKWRPKGTYWGNNTKGRQHIVQKMRFQYDIFSCDHSSLNVPDSDYLEAWKIKYRFVGIGFKPFIAMRDGVEDRWFMPAWQNTYGTITISGKAVWAKKHGPENWSRTAVPESKGLKATHNIATWHRYRGAQHRSNLVTRSKSFCWDHCQGLGITLPCQPFVRPGEVQEPTPPSEGEVIPPAA